MIRRRSLIRVGALAFLLAAPGCGVSDVEFGPGEGRGTGEAGGSGGSEASAAPATAGQADGHAAPEAGSGRIDIYLAGDATPKTFGDGLRGQTPRDFKIALSKYYAMTSANDPAPALCFDLGASEVVADLSGDTLVGTCATSSIPSALYTHGRVRVEWAQYTVSGALHHLGSTLAGDFTFFRAYSDTVHDGVPLRAGQGFVRFSASGTEFPVTYPPALAEAPGIRVETTGGECWMTFAYSRPLPIDKTNTDSHWARFSWEIFEGFRWSDSSASSFAAGIWDVSTVTGETENVLVPGTTGYHTTSSID